MSKQSTLHWQYDDSSYYDITIRNEYTRFACMFYLFTLFAFLTTIILFIFANNSYHNESETIQRHFIPYTVLGSISFILFFIFFIGSLVYTSKFIKKFRLNQTFKPPTPLPRSLQTNDNLKTNESFLMNTDESYYATTKSLSEQKSRTTDLSSHPCQTDV